MLQSTTTSTTYITSGFVAVGLAEPSSILISDNGSSWSSGNAPYNEAGLIYNGIAFDGFHTWVASVNNGIIKSSSGNVWSALTPLFSATVNCVSYSKNNLTWMVGGDYVAGDIEYSLFRSDNATSWHGINLQNLGITSVYDLAYSSLDNRWIALTAGTYKIIYSDDNGDTWQAIDDTTGGYVLFGEGAYVAGRGIATDGVGNWVAVADASGTTFGNSIIYSTDNGLSWTAAYQQVATNSLYGFQSQIGNGVATDGLNWVVVGDSTGTDSILVTNTLNLSGWTSPYDNYSSSAYFNESGKGVLYDPVSLQWIAVGKSSNTILLSTNPSILWTNAASAGFQTYPAAGINMESTIPFAEGTRIAVRYVNPYTTTTTSFSFKTTTTTTQPPIKMLAVGLGNPSILTSINGDVWIPDIRVNQIEYTDYTDIAYDGRSTWVATIGDGIVYSVDGKHWSNKVKVFGGSNPSANCVAFDGHSTWLVGGNGDTGNLFRSNNGIFWTPVPFVANSPLDKINVIRKIAYKNAIWVAVGGLTNPDVSIIRSINGGVDWTAGVSTTSDPIFGNFSNGGHGIATQIGDKWIAVGIGFSPIMISNNFGVSWGPPSGGDTFTSDFAYSVAASSATDGTFLAVGSSPETILVTNDYGSHWHNPTNSGRPFSQIGYGVTCIGDTSWIAVGEGEQTILKSADDGETWQTVSSGGFITTDTSLLNTPFGSSVTITYDNQSARPSATMIAVGNGTNPIVRSWDGVNWSSDGITYDVHPSYPNSIVYDIAYDGTSRWVAPYQTGCLYSDDDGASWKTVTGLFTGSDSSSGLSVAYNYAYSTWMMGGGDSSVILYTSTNGKDWRQPATTGLGVFNIISLVPCGSRWIVGGTAVGSGSNIWYSDNNGESWTPANAGAFTQVQGVAYDNINDVLIAVGFSASYSVGSIQISTDKGVTWHIPSSGAFLENINVRGVDYGNGTWVIVGSTTNNHSTMYISKDNGNTWRVPNGINSQIFTSAVTQLNYGQSVRYISSTKNDPTSIGVGDSVWVATGYGDHPILISTDDGETWLLPSQKDAPYFLNSGYSVAGKYIGTKIEKLTTTTSTSTSPPTTTTTTDPHVNFVAIAKSDNARSLVVSHNGYTWIPPSTTTWIYNTVGVGVLKGSDPSADYRTYNDSLGIRNIYCNPYARYGRNSSNIPAWIGFTLGQNVTDGVVIPNSDPFANGSTVRHANLYSIIQSDDGNNWSINTTLEFLSQPLVTEDQGYYNGNLGCALGVISIPCTQSIEGRFDQNGKLKQRIIFVGMGTGYGTKNGYRENCPILVKTETSGVFNVPICNSTIYRPDSSTRTSGTDLRAGETDAGFMNSAVNAIACSDDQIAAVIADTSNSYIDPFGVVAVGDQYSYYSTDGGYTWMQSVPALTIASTLNGVCYVRGDVHDATLMNNVYIATGIDTRYGKSMFVSYNSGCLWEFIDATVQFIDPTNHDGPYGVPYGAGLCACAGNNQILLGGYGINTMLIFNGTRSSSTFTSWSVITVENGAFKKRCTSIVWNNTTKKFYACGTDDDGSDPFMKYSTDGIHWFNLDTDPVSTLNGICIATTGL